MLDDLISQFEADRLRYQGFEIKMKGLLSEILDANDIKTHHVTSRCKDLDSLRRKIVEKAEKYTQLDQITDLVGVRVITYFDTDVDKISELIKQEFAIDWSNSIDKRKTRAPDSFGYMSAHFVVQLSDARSGLTENRAFVPLKAEIQVRSILQHAWAEIEHDLGYKSNLEIPREFQRRFSRLAGLLEIADDEFSLLRDQLLEYGKDVAGVIQITPEKVEIDAVTIAIFMDQYKEAQLLDRSIAKVFNATIQRNESAFALSAVYLKRTGVANIAQLMEYVRVFSPILADVVSDHFQLNAIGRPKMTLPCGTCLYYLCWAILASQDRSNELATFLSLARDKNEVGDDDRNLAERLIRIYNQCIQALPNTQ